MSDDTEEKVTNLKQSKDPKQAALNKIREGTAKEWNGKIDAQVKRTVDAKKIYDNEKRALGDIIADAEQSAREFAELTRDL